jgi:hypothetical protein
MKIYNIIEKGVSWDFSTFPPQQNTTFQDTKCTILKMVHDNIYNIVGI